MLYKNLILCLLVLLPGFKASAPSVHKWVISQNSGLAVNGTTNINKFTCDIAAYDDADTLTLNRSKADQDVSLSGTVGLKVQSFDCHNSMMTHDLRKTLKEKEYPRLYIRFINLSELPELTTHPSSITGMVNIELAGITKHFEIQYRISKDAQNMIHLLGARDVAFSDFNLTPPRKLGGMIRTNDKLSVTFHLKIKAI